MLGTYVLSAGYYDAYYRKAAQVRRLIRQDFLNALEQCDLICGPACPTTAFAIGEHGRSAADVPDGRIFTISLNLSGLPGLSLPVGLGRDTGMPVGLQLFAGNMEEAGLLSAAAPWKRICPDCPNRRLRNPGRIFRPFLHA
jgi:aspartyl-tRNA(Asn)/glutamyl-tRNA(Gln) amidotransferase subunit A